MLFSQFLSGILKYYHSSTIWWIELMNKQVLFRFWGTESSLTLASYITIFLSFIFIWSHTEREQTHFRNVFLPFSPHLPSWHKNVYLNGHPRSFSSDTILMTNSIVICSLPTYITMKHFVVILKWMLQNYYKI